MSIEPRVPVALIDDPGPGLLDDHVQVCGRVHWRLTHPSGEYMEGVVGNLVTLIGIRRYAEAGGGVAGVPAACTGMKLGTGTTAPATTGAGAALAAYLDDSHQALASTPAATTVSGKRRITYTATWAAGKATTASEIREAVMVNDTLANATSPEANTLARVVFAAGTIPAKSALDTLQLTWTHDIG